jgi:hypothetical protein
VAQAAEQQAHAHHAVADDHDRGVDGVARHAGGVGATGQHHGQHQRHLDHRDGQRQHQRTERLTHFVCDHLGVVHRADNGAHQRGQADQQHCRTQGQPESGREHRHGAEGKKHLPVHGFILYGSAAPACVKKKPRQKPGQ